MAKRLSGPFYGRKGTRYHPHAGLVAAANTALLLDAPLLLTGEPGCGKTDFAWAAARALGKGGPRCCYVRSDTRARDLLYHYDAVRRFGDAQMSKSGEAAWPHRYIELRPLGLGLMAREREVVLIDEIDKAPRDLPNDLLWELDQGRFEIPEIGEKEPPPYETELRRVMEPPEGGERPLIVVTSNVERQLPDAFLRRCVFFHIPFPAWGEEVERPGRPRREDNLLDILRDHVPEGGRVQGLYEGALRVFMELREPGRKLTKKPATAELIGWVRALVEFQGDAAWADPVGRLLKVARGKEVDLGEVPGLGCLVKLQEDLRKVEEG